MRSPLTVQGWESNSMRRQRSRAELTPPIILLSCVVMMVPSRIGRFTSPDIVNHVSGVYGLAETKGAAYGSLPSLAQNPQPRRRPAIWQPTKRHHTGWRVPCRIACNGTRQKRLTIALSVVRPQTVGKNEHSCEDMDMEPTDQRDRVNQQNITDTKIALLRVQEDIRQREILLRLHDELRKAAYSMIRDWDAGRGHPMKRDTYLHHN